MKNTESKTFSEWMTHIGNEHNAQLEQEEKAAQRAELFAKIRKVTLGVVFAILLVIVYTQRTEIGNSLTSVLVKPENQAWGKNKAQAEDGELAVSAGNSRANFGNNLKQTREKAAERDQILEEIAK